ncbi:hypothetical protein HK102_011463 [Quaeritorhiza haematococci]|nr:hypothetical protein HK102_011463 [Quaeritorhiza haematococci]
MLTSEREDRPAKDLIASGVPIPPNMPLGVLIGRSGWNIRRLAQTSGARISLKADSDAGLQTAAITGTTEQCEAAIMLLKYEFFKHHTKLETAALKYGLAWTILDNDLERFASAMSRSPAQSSDLPRGDLSGVGGRWAKFVEASEDRRPEADGTIQLVPFNNNLNRILEEKRLYSIAFTPNNRGPPSDAAGVFPQAGALEEFVQSTESQSLDEVFEQVEAILLRRYGESRSYNTIVMMPRALRSWREAWEELAQRGFRGRMKAGIRLGKQLFWETSRNVIKGSTNATFSVEEWRTEQVRENINCTFDVNVAIASKTVQNLVCTLREDFGFKFVGQTDDQSALAFQGDIHRVSLNYAIAEDDSNTFTRRHTRLVFDENRQEWVVAVENMKLGRDRLVRISVVSGNPMCLDFRLYLELKRPTKTDHTTALRNWVSEAQARLPPGDQKRLILFNAPDAIKKGIILERVCYQHIIILENADFTVKIKMIKEDYVSKRGQNGSIKDNKHYKITVLPASWRKVGKGEVCSTLSKVQVEDMVRDLLKALDFVSKLVEGTAGGDLWAK